MQRQGLKNIIWAFAIAVSLAALLVGFFFTAFGRWYGDKTRPVMNLGASAVKSETQEKETKGTVADGTLHSLKETKDGGQAYLDSLYYMTDRSFSGLKDSGLSSGTVWTSETGELPMNSLDRWTIVLPSDGSKLSPANAAMVAKPRVLVLMIGSEGVSGLSREVFVGYYDALIGSIVNQSPETVVVCCSLCSVTPAYLGAELSADQIPTLNSYIQQVCQDTGAYYADLMPTLTEGGYLRAEFANADGRTLSTAGLNAVLGYLKTHVAS